MNKYVTKKTPLALCVGLAISLSALANTSVDANGATCTQATAVCFDTVLTIQERAIYRRAVDAAVWGMPFANFHAMREGHRTDGGINLNDIAYNSKIQDWRLQITTPNNTTPYAMAYWNLSNGPVVIEIPRSEANVGVYGSMLDSWQRPLEDVGAKGKDGGAGAKYIILPPNYQGAYPGGRGHVVVKSSTFNNFMLLRPLIKDTRKSNLKLAENFVKKIKIYGYNKADAQPVGKHKDMYGKALNLVPAYDDTLFDRINALVQEEPIERKDLAMMGLLNTLGIEKGSEFKPTAKVRKILKAAAYEAHQYMNDTYINTDINLQVFKHWSLITGIGAVETSMRYEYPTYLDINGRANLFNVAFAPVKNFDIFKPAAFYLLSAKDTQGQILNGSNNYKLHVPAKVPTKQFWSALVYDLDDATWFDHQPKPGVASNDKGVIKNKDGSVDLYFGAKAPKGKEANWIPTTEAKEYFVYFRLYGPTPEFFRRQWVLDGIEKVN